MVLEIRRVANGPVISRRVNGGFMPYKLEPGFFMVFVFSMLFPDSGGDAPVPSSMLFPDSGFEIAEEPLGRNPAWAQFQWNLKICLIYHAVHLVYGKSNYAIQHKFARAA